MSITLSDAVSYYRAVSDTTHKFWAYFQAVAAGTAAFAWAREPAQLQLFVFLSIAFTVFAILNRLLVVSSQAEAVTVAECIKHHAKKTADSVPTELRPILVCIKPYPAARIAYWHAGLSLATLGAVWCRYFF